MSKVLFFNVPAHGHTNPTLALVKALVEQGEQIIYYSLDDFRVVLEDAGAEFRSYRQPFPFDHHNIPANVVQLMCQVLITCQLLLPQLLAETQAIKPDYIIHDSLCPWGRYIAEILHIPAICSTTTFVLTNFVGLSMPSLLPSMFQQTLIAWQDLRALRSIQQELQTKYHLKKPRIEDAYTNFESLTLVHTSKEFQPLGNTFDARFLFIGPSITPRPASPPFPFEHLNGKPVIYISFGTIFNDQVDLFRACIEAFANIDCQVIIALGHKVQPEELGLLPDHFFVKPFVPQLEVLQHTSLFITHGGMNSVNEGLYYGIPLLVIPQAADQMMVAKRVQQLQCGRILWKNQVSSSRLRQLAYELLANPLYAQASTRMGTFFRQAGGVQKALEAIKNFKRIQQIQ